jgi:diguanylate cyclase (GGDEF)-like protein
MLFDPFTLIVASAVTATTVGALLIFAWLQNRSHQALAMWGGAYLAGTLSVGLLLTRNHTPLLISLVLPFTIIAAAYGVILRGALAFSGRPLHPAAMLAGAMIWLASCFVPPLFESTSARVALISMITAVYSFLSAQALWRDREERLLSRYPMVACLVLHGMLLVARTIVALVVAMPDASVAMKTPWVALVAFEPIIAVIAGGFLQLSLAKERTELVQRRAATTDELTGISSRRAFIEEGEARVAKAVERATPLALLLIDLDHFKRINDTFGHYVGDRVLQAFAWQVSRVLRPDDLFGRIGGEEFAVLISQAGSEAASVVAEQVRTAVEAISLDGEAPFGLSASIGLATGFGATADLGVMLRQADQALYGAKSAGRNRVNQLLPAVSAPRLQVVSA